MPSWTKPTDTRVDQVIALANAPEQLKLFFDRLQNPAWLGALQKRGLFENPPRPVTHGWEGAQSSPIWPQSGYLARMAPLVPEQVFPIVRKLIGTENISVRADLVDVALGLPARLSAQLVPGMVKWLNEPGLHGTRPDIAQKLGKLMVSLAQQGEVGTALRLCKALLAVERPTVSGNTEGSRMELRPKAEARIDKWAYRSVVGEDVAVLALAAGRQTLETMISCLRAALRIERGEGAAKDVPDYSSIWRPAIEPHEQNVARDFEVRDILITGLRDLLDRVIDTGTMPLEDVASILGRQVRPVFQRLALYALRRHGASALELVAQWLTNYALFEEPEVHHEYTTLEADYFGLLPPAAQEIILNWIDAGLDRDEVTARFQRLEGRVPSQEEIGRRVRTWQWQHLAPIATSLPEAWAQRYNELVDEFGELDHPEFLSYSRVQMGEKTPMTAEELRPLPVPAIIEAIRSWQVTPEPFGPTVEGLAQTVGQLASEEPARFSREAKCFIGLEPPYIRHLAHGFLSAVNQGKPLEWEPVLSLCKWAVEQPRELPGGVEPTGYMDPDWGWARSVVGHLLYAALEAEEAEIPFDLRQLTWDVIVPLTEDPDPADRAYAGPDDVHRASLNTVRGQAMRTVMRYALWVHRNLEAMGTAHQRQRGFDEMVEVRDVLEKHLDVQLDPSLAIRAVYGQWFAWLVLLDKVWASSHVAVIFPRSSKEKLYWRASWDAYVTMSRPYDSAWFLLRGEYRRAVERLDDQDDRTRQRLNPDEKLAEHLMVQYWRGNLGFRDADGLLEAFLDRAPDVIGSHAITFVGHVLHDSTEVLPHSIVARLHDLWECRLITYRENPSKHPEGLAAFGWWFASGAFADSWALRQLGEVLRLTHRIDMDDVVVERLARAAPDYPRESISCLEILIDMTTEPWTIRHWVRDIRTILQAALESRDEDARATAEALIDKLGRKGHHDYRDLRSL